MSSHRWLIWWLIPTHILNKMVSHLIMMSINPPKLTRDLDGFWVWLLLLLLMVKVNQCLSRMICYMLHFFWIRSASSISQLCGLHPFWAINFYFKLLDWLCWFEHCCSHECIFFCTTVISSMSTWPESCFEITYLGRCLQPVWFILHKSDRRFAGHLT